MKSREEIANVISHFAGIILSVAALVLMVIFSAIRGTTLHVISSLVFGLSMIALYTSSTLAHWLPEGPRKERFFTFDQLAIFLLIAGTYTPLALVALNGTLGWIVFGIEWGLAIVGILRNLKRINDPQSGVDLFDIILYVGMGWLVVFVAGPVLYKLTLAGFLWIIIGGLLYSLGIVFFRVARFRYHHFVWHMFVLAGTASHFTAVFFYILP